MEAAHQSLEELGHEVVRVPLLPPMEQVRATLESLDTDLVFNLFEGFDFRPRTEATVTGMLSELGLRYTGCSSAALAAGLDKVKAKELMRAHGIPTPDYQKLTPETVSGFRLRFPCIVKGAKNHCLIERNREAQRPGRQPRPLGQQRRR